MPKSSKPYTEYRIYYKEGNDSEPVGTANGYTPGEAALQALDELGYCLRRVVPLSAVYKRPRKQRAKLTMKQVFE